MKKGTVIFSFSLVILLNSYTYLCADESRDVSPKLLPSYKTLSFLSKIDQLFPNYSKNTPKKTPTLFLGYKSVLSGENFPLRIKDATAQFSTAVIYSKPFILNLAPVLYITTKLRKDHGTAVFQISGINAIVWAFDKYIMKESWADISFNTIVENFKYGYSWDNEGFITNQFSHPYHGAMYHSVSRANGLSFLESTVYTFLGSFMWEFFLEAERPAANDSIMTTLGGMTLGETLFRVAGLVVDENATGIGRILREILAFYINPAYGYRFFSGKASRLGNTPKKRHYSLRFPVGAYSSFTAKPGFLVATQLEYKDVFKNETSRIHPYDWFSFDLRVGFSEKGLHDKEIFSTGILTGKKVKNRLVGLFGTFNYIDTYTAQKMSAVGVGPGLVVVSDSESSLFFNGSGVVSVIFGGSSPSLGVKDEPVGSEIERSYYLGPGMLGRFMMELGRRGLGSIHTGFSQYWVHCAFTHTNEFLSILSLNLRYDLSRNSQLSLGYEYYLRQAKNQEQRFTGTQDTVRALYVFKF